MPSYSSHVEILSVLSDYHIIIIFVHTLYLYIMWNLVDYTLYAFYRYILCFPWVLYFLLPCLLCSPQTVDGGVYIEDFFCYWSVQLCRLHFINNVFGIQTHAKYVLDIFFWSTVIFELSKDEAPHRFVFYMLSLAAILFGIQHNFISSHVPCVFWSQHGSPLLSSSFKQMLKRPQKANLFYSVSKIVHHDEQTLPFLRWNSISVYRALCGGLHAVLLTLCFHPLSFHNGRDTCHIDTPFPEPPSSHKSAQL